MSLDLDAITDFRDAMAKEGIHYSGEIEADGELHRFRVDGDPAGKRNGFYLLHIDENPAGIFGCNKRFGYEHKFHWAGKTATKLTPEERRALAEKAAAGRAKKLADERARHAAAAELAKTMWEAAAPAAEHPYLTKKGIGGHNVRVGQWLKERREGGTYVAARNALLIPMKNSRGLVSLQAIFAEPMKVGEESRGKDFIYGGEKQGCWATIGAPSEFDGRVTLLVAEGYATGASLHEASGLAVLVAFDAGNLVHVAREIRRLMPAARIVICGDNDAWTLRPINNPGKTKAIDAARTIGAEWVIPSFKNVPDVDEGAALPDDQRRALPTDFNDLQVREGKSEVARQLLAALRPEPEQPAPAPTPVEPEPEEAPPWDGEPAYVDPDDNGHLPPGEEDARDTGGYFRVLGHDRDQIYVYQHRMQLVVSRGIADWSEAAMISIAPLNWWEAEFPGGKGGMDKKAAHNWLVRAAEEKGFYDPDCRRGRGAWRDAGRTVFHFGDRLWVDGDMMPVTKIKSNYVYEQARRLRPPADARSTAEDGRKIIEMAKLFSWSRPASALLWAGWCALAPIGGALGWRPHVWVTGGAGSGKTTILSLAHWLLNGATIFAQGNSTEAGIRQTLRTDSLAVCFDESEQNNDREENRMQNILSLTRQSSSETDAKTLKGTQGGSAMDFQIRSMFHLSSIQVGIKQQADHERMSILNLRPKRDDSDIEARKQAAETWAILSAAIADLRADAELPARILRRSLELLPTTMANIEVFSRAAAEKFGSQRNGDQYGTLLAGAWSLVSDRHVTLQEARDMIDRYDWAEYMESSETEESTKALGVLLERKIRLPGAQGEASVYELVAAAANQPVETLNRMSHSDADAVLRRHGMMVRFNGSDPRKADFLVSYNSEELKRLMDGTPFKADLKGQLLRVPDAYRHDAVRFASLKDRCTAIPLHRILDGIGPPRPPEDDPFNVTF